MFSKRVLWAVFALSVIAALGARGALAEDTAGGVKKVAVVPFAMNSDKDLTFLQNGIYDMLASRLASGEVVVTEKARILDAVKSKSGAWNAQSAAVLGKELGADFVLIGSLTVFGESVSMDATMVDVSGARPPLAVFNQAKGLDAVIPTVDDFAKQVNAKIFGRGAAPEESAAAQGAGSAAQPDIYAHPEKLLQGGMAVQGAKSGEGGATPFVVSGTGAATDYWRSKTYRETILGMALGDVDGDSKTEAVFLTSRKVTVKRREGTAFKAVAEYEMPSLKVLAVDAADVNGNGKEEIFVSAVTITNNSLSSFVLEWDGKTLVPIAGKQGYYFRVVKNPARGKTLLGQRKGGTDVFLPGVHEMRWTGGGYTADRRVRLKRSIWVFGLNFGDEKQEGLKGPVALDSDDLLKVFSPEGDVEYRTSARYGGSEASIDIKDGDTLKRNYIPRRVLVEDLNGDGRFEVVAVRNGGLTGRFFENYRNYDSAKFEGLVWDGLGLSEAWRTRELKGYVTDYAVGDFDNDGKPELVAVVVKKGFSVMGDKDSLVVSYDMDTLAGVKGVPRQVEQGE
jgi:TolB-like protein